MNDEQKRLLKLVGAALFGGSAPDVGSEKCGSLFRESKAQAVFPLVFSLTDDRLREASDPEKYAAWSELFLVHSIAGTRNFDEHGELHELMTAHDIPYVVIKGLASAMYYPEPSLRTMGDVDFLVDSSDIAEAGRLLESVGFSVDHGDADDGVHIAYQRPPQSVWELHWSVNGIPGGETGERIRKELDTTITTAETAEIDGVTCRVPDKLHHGLILLLHTAAHLTSEGVGLRHLCDWVMFASSLSDADFRSIFEKKLKAFGLWRFAQILTLLGVRFLGAPRRVWAMEALESRTATDELLDGLMEDILNGGNFGLKDGNRYREIKYISDRDERTVRSGGIVRQGFKTLNTKVFADYKTIDRHRVLLPLGYLAESGRYLGLLLSGRRKSSGTREMLREASERKRIYAALKLFE